MDKSYRVRLIQKYEMQNLTFKSKVLKDGMIQIPTSITYENQDIEVWVRLKNKAHPIF